MDPIDEVRLGQEVERELATRAGLPVEARLELLEAEAIARRQESARILDLLEKMTEAIGMGSR